ncbi:PKD domain-containing protein [Jatrophihabitans fulvus]
MLSVFGAPADDAAPVASFTSSCNARSCTFDASGSSDPDGTLTDWRWDFGDGTVGTGRTVTHPYTEGGLYTVGLTVTDDHGAGGSTARQVVGGGAFAVDGFDRTVAKGFGAADLGYGWTVGGNSANASVSAGSARYALTAAGTQLTGTLTRVPRTDSEVSVAFSLPVVPVGAAATTTVVTRRVSSGNEYDTKVLVYPDRRITLRVTKVVAGKETILAGPVLVASPYTAGTVLRVRAQASGTGTTALRARVWRDGDAEPSSWAATATDSSAELQAAGYPGYAAGLLTGATSLPFIVLLDAFRARPTVVAANTPPTAAITAGCTYLTCSLSSAGSTDADGRIVSSSWDFGDGAAAEGSAVSHAYATAGTYPVTLTVTDDAGATAITTQTVTATSPPLNQPPVARFTATCSGRTCTFDASASSDDEGVRAYGWDFGDGATGSRPVETHTFVAGGTYSVRLTVTDEYDATDAATQSLVVTGSFVRDTFGRVVDNGWGSADVGGAWSLSGTASRFTVRPGAGTMSLATPGAQLAAFLPSVKRTVSDIVATVRTSAVPAGGPLYLTFSGRRVSAGNEYAAKVLVYPDGSVTVRLVRVVAGVETVLAAPVRLSGVVVSAGMSLTVRVQVTGSAAGTTLRARAWPAAGVEPGTWPVSASDTTATLQASGYVGVVAYLSSAATTSPVAVDVTSLTAD